MKHFTAWYLGKGYEGSIPESMEELTPAQVLPYCEALLKPTEAECAVAMLLAVSGLPKKVARQLSAVHLHSLIVQHKMLVMDDKKPFTTQLLPMIKARGKKYYGPTDFFGNVTGDEYTFMYAHFSLYQETKDEKELWKAVACLYRKRKWWWMLTKLFPEWNTGDCRLPFNSETVEARAARIGKGRKAAVQAVLMWICGCMANMQKVYPNVFSGGGNKQVDLLGFHKVMLAVAKDGTFADFDKVEKQYVHNLLSHLETQCKEAKELERKMSSKSA